MHLSRPWSMLPTATAGNLYTNDILSVTQMRLMELLSSEPKPRLPPWAALCMDGGLETLWRISQCLRASWAHSWSHTSPGH